MSEFEWYRKFIGGHWYQIRNMANGGMIYWTKHPLPGDKILCFEDHFGRL